MKQSLGVIWTMVLAAIVLWTILTLLQFYDRLTAPYELALTSTISGCIGITTALLIPRRSREGLSLRSPRGLPAIIFLLALPAASVPTALSIFLMLSEMTTGASTSEPRATVIGATVLFIVMAQAAILMGLVTMFRRSSRPG
ncbi:hypothetical protein LX81_03037 [Palleronia aestuarii]|uniref:Uncharacterized protein n=1 Tax=Palleronia aestuarii TaxID=568105 RepID=A0A2W7N2A7_9RHOB|nr:hypothetical protein [Palleronia aestuarii]PZX14238.1 hypothetical protein LX81_03037 [Palleronia aestuarii]